MWLITIALYLLISVLLLILGRLRLNLTLRPKWISIVGRMTSIRYLLLWVFMIVLPLYAIIIIGIGTYHDIVFSGSTFQNQVISLFGDEQHWRFEAGRPVEFIAQDQSFYQSFVSSGIDSISFFLLIGFATALVGLKDPKNETIHNRVDYLLSGEGVDAEARNKAVCKIEKLACYNDSMTANLVIEDAEPKEGRFRISVNYRAKIRNMFKKETYVDDGMTCELMLDNEFDDKNIIGQVQHIRVNNEDVLERIESFHKVGLHETTPIKLVIPPNSSVDYESQQWMWEKFGNNYYFGVKRYTKRLQIKVSNSSNSDSIYVKAIESQQKDINRCIQISASEWTEVGITNTILFDGPMDEKHELNLVFKIDNGRANINQA